MMDKFEKNIEIVDDLKDKRSRLNDLYDELDKAVKYESIKNSLSFDSILVKYKPFYKNKHYEVEVFIEVDKAITEYMGLYMLIYHLYGPLSTKMRDFFNNYGNLSSKDELFKFKIVSVDEP